MKDTLRQTAVLITLAITLVTNYLSVSLPLNGLTPAEISDRFQVYFVPAGYVFSIWGIIYLGLIAFAIFQALPSQRANPRLRAAGWWIALSGLANSAWIFAWHYQHFLLSLLVMLALLTSLIVTYVRLGIGRTAVPAAEEWAVRLPIRIYLGWITVATIANTADVLDYLHWNRFGIAPEIWMGVLLVAVVGITGAVILTRRDAAYPLVILWALAGITVKQAGTPAVVIPTWIAFGLVGAILAVELLARWRGRKLAPAAG